MARSHPYSGFTLLELSIVLIVIALLTSMGLVATMGAVESAKKGATENKLNVIEASLANFRERYGRFPCPGSLTLLDSDANYGLEAANEGACSGGTPEATFLLDKNKVEGGIPARTLGLPDSFMFDGWGRRFSYAVDVHATDRMAFASLKLDEQCSIAVNDYAGGVRSTGAIYTLISYGPNGHGAYISGTSRQSSGSTNVAEQANCHCSANGATVTPYSANFVQQEEQLDSGTNAFDDIIRFKERWQIQNAEDIASYSRYTGPDLAVGYSFAGGTNANIHLYKRKCGVWGRVTPYTGLSTASTIGRIGGVGFTPQNKYLFVYSELQNCQLYTVGDALLTDLGVSAVPSCPTYNASNVIAMSQNGYLAISYGTSPYVRIWKLGNGQYNLIASSVPTNLTGRPTLMAFSRNGEYLVVSDGAGNTRMFIRDLFHRYSDLDSTLAPPSLPASPKQIAFSPNGDYLATTEISPSRQIRIWKRNTANGAFVAASTATLSLATLPADPTALAFSPDGAYLIVSGGSTVNINGNVIIYKIDKGDTFTAVTIASVPYPTDLGVPTTSTIGAAFAPDSSYVALLQSAAPYGVIFLKKVDANNFSLGSSNLVAAGVNSSSLGMISLY